MTACLGGPSHFNQQGQVVRAVDQRPAQQQLWTCMGNRQLLTNRWPHAAMHAHTSIDGGENNKKVVMAHETPGCKLLLGYFWLAF